MTPKSTLRAPANLSLDDLAPRMRIRLFRLCNAMCGADRTLVDAIAEHCSQPDIEKPGALFRFQIENRDIPVGIDEDGEIETIKAQEALTNRDEDDGVKARKDAEPKPTRQPEIQALVDHLGAWTQEATRPDHVIVPQLSRDAAELRALREKESTGWRLTMQSRGWHHDRITQAARELEAVA